MSPNGIVSGGAGWTVRPKAGASSVSRLPSQALAAARAGSSTSTAASSGRSRGSFTSATSGATNSARRVALELTYAASAQRW